MRLSSVFNGVNGVTRIPLNTPKMDRKNAQILRKHSITSHVTLNRLILIFLIFSSKKLFKNSTPTLVISFYAYGNSTI